MTTSAALAEPSSRPGSQTGSPTDHQPGLVSDDALRTLALTAQPFSSEISDGDWFSDNSTREQLVDIKEALVNGEDLLLITGESGSGKTVLLKQLSGSGGSRIQCFSVRGSERFSTFNLFSGLLEAFKLKPPAELEDTLKDVIPCLQALAERNMLGVIVLDDANLVSDQELSLLLGSLQYLNGGEDSLVRVLLAAKPEFETRIPGLLATTSELPYATLAIEPFDIGRSAAYLEHRLNKVGTFSEFPFSEQQLLSICQSANGLPSGLNAVAAAELNALHQAVIGNADGSVPNDGQNATLGEGAANQSHVGQNGGSAVASASFLQKQPVRMVLGLAAVAMLAIAAWLFANPTGTTGEDGSFSVVSSSPVKPISTDGSTSSSADNSAKTSAKTSNNDPNPEQIALLNESTATDKVVADNNSTSSAGTTPNANSATTDIQGANKATTTASNNQAQSGSDKVTTAQTSETTTQNATRVIAPLSTSEPADKSTSQTGIAAKKPAPTATTTPSATAPASSDKPSVTAAVKPEQPKPEATASAAATAPETASTSSENALPLESANWVLVQDRELYTVQMSASDQRNDVEEFLKRSKLDAPNSIFSFKRGNNTWFALVHGLYPTITEARNAIESMPKSAKANQPWIRAISQIQDSVKNN